MTKRSVILGLLGAATVCAITYFNDWVLRQTHFVGNNMPVSIYGMLIIFVLFLNRFLGRFSLRGRELAVILALMLAACCLPGSGLMRTFPDSLVLPHHYARTEPAWKEHKVLDDVPPRMLVDLSRDENRVLDGYVQGLSEGSVHIGIRDVPWHAWVRPISFWAPIALTMFLAIAGLAVVVHRQWSEHEHLPYPIATFTEALFPTEGHSVTPLWRNRAFRIGMAAVFLIHLNNFLALWFPKALIEVNLRPDFWPLANLVPIVAKGGGWFIFRPAIFFAVIGLSFFIGTELAAAFGFGPLLWAIVCGTFATYGVNLASAYTGGGYIGIQPRVFIIFGACVGVFLTLLYSGRHYYAGVFSKAVLPFRKVETDNHAVWGARVFIALIVLFVVQLAMGGIDWQLAALYAASLVITYTVSARIMAEGGLFHIKIDVFPCAMIWGFFGAAALGHKTILLLQMVTMVLFIDPRETLMPFLANANKLLEMRKMPVGRTCALAGVAIIIGLAVAIPMTIYLQYDVPEATQGDAWAFRYVPIMPFENAVAVKQKLNAMGTLESAEALSGWQRFAEMRPVGACAWAFLAGLVLVAICAVCRIRFPWWPIHPLLFVVWAKSHIGIFAFSFMLGWTVKKGVMRYGGNRLYNRLKPFMIGIIAGEILGAVVPSIVGAVYYYITGDQPVSYVLYMG